MDLKGGKLGIQIGKIGGKGCWVELVSLAYIYEENDSFFSIIFFFRLKKNKEELASKHKWGGVKQRESLDSCEGQLFVGAHLLRYQ